MNIKYISGGLLGDFIHQLSIVNEMYIKTNKKGIVYISNIGDPFRNGLEKTYKDLYEIVILQDYIYEFKIHNNEEYDINLSTWRYYNSVDTLYNICKLTYNIEWAKNKWLNNINILKEWENKIVINTVQYRFPNMSFFEPLKNVDLSNYVFVSFLKNDYDYFINKTNLLVNYYSLKSLMELCIIVNSCKLFIGSLSAPMAIATALQTKCAYGIDDTCPYIYLFRNLDKQIPYIKYSID